MKNIMFNLKTLGTHAGCTVLSIGGIRFDEISLGKTFYVEISQKSCEKHGLRVDTSTVAWWAEQNDTVKGLISQTKEHGYDLTVALIIFSDWVQRGEPAYIWSNCPSFDCAILADCYRRTGLSAPWHFRDERCYRTLKSLAPHMGEIHTGYSHHALSDAQAQAVHAGRVMKWLTDRS